MNVVNLGLKGLSGLSALPATSQVHPWIGRTKVKVRTFC